MVSKAPANPMTAALMPAHNGKAALPTAREAVKTIKKKGASEQATPEHDLAAQPPGEQAGVLADTAAATEAAGKDWHDAAQPLELEGGGGCGRESLSGDPAGSSSSSAGASSGGLQLAQAPTSSAGQGMGNQITPTATSPTSEAPANQGDDRDGGFLWLPLGAVAVAGLANGSGSGSGTVSAAAPQPAANSIVTGTVVAGPVIAGHTLKVEIYAANGSTKLGEAALDATGKFSVNVGTYTGVIIARVVNTGNGQDYLDEATGLAKDLNATLMATAVVPGGTIAVNINPLTAIAAQKAGLAADGSGSIANATLVTNANAAVAAAFGLADLTGTTVVATNSGSFNATDGLSSGEKYGAVLAALSGVDQARGGDTQATINEIVAGLTLGAGTGGAGGTATLSTATLDTVMVGARAAAKTAGGSDSTSLTAIVSNLTAQVSASVTIDTVATDGVINAGEQTVAITGTTVAGATVALSIGGNTRTATVTGTTWTYNLQASDITAMADGGETIRATATLSGGSTASATRTIVLDTIAPSITSVAISSASGAQNSTLNAGDTVSVSVTLSEATTVSTAGGTPQLDLNIGGRTVQANYASGSGSTSLVFNYAIQAGQTDTNGISIAPNSLNLNGGSLLDAAGNAATLLHAAVTDNTGFRVDTTAPTLAPTSYNSAENATAVAKLAASDASALSYSLAGAGADNSLFKLSADGQLSFASAPNFEQPGSAAASNAYAITVDITDAAGNTTRQAVSVNVTNQDEVAPSITSNIAASAILENSGADQTIYTATSTDTDDIATGATAYSLKAGSDATAFSINATSGSVKLRANPDFEAKPSYSFTVVATDAAGNASEQAVTLAISNRDEVAPTITSGEVATAILENSGTNQTIYTATSTDTGDIATGATSYSLKSGSDAGLSIDAASGAVKLTDKPDFETKSSYSFTVVATDAAGNASENVVSMAINDVDEIAPTVTIASGAYSSSTDTLVLTGANFSTLLDAGEDATTDIKARMDWSKMLWDINGDNATTADVGFTLADISVVEVTSDTQLSIVLNKDKGIALEATAGFSGSPADTLNISTGFAKDTAGNVASTDGNSNAPLSIPAQVGTAQIDLGTMGKLIAPVQVEGKWYYFWDRSGDGAVNGADQTSYQTLKDIFTQDALGNPTAGAGLNETYRYATINGVKLALPTANGGLVFPDGLGYQRGTVYSDAGTTSNNGNSLPFDDMLAIWDAYNGTLSEPGNDPGFPSGWLDDSYLTATPWDDGHLGVSLFDGSVDLGDDAIAQGSVALQVLSPDTILSGTVVAGPVVAGNGLTVKVYAADGSKKLGQAKLDATGKFTIDLGTYNGIIIARVEDSDAGNDYLDEATGAPKDLNATLMAVAVVNGGGKVDGNVNALTSIAAQKAGLSPDGSGSLDNATAVKRANLAVASAFGLTDLTGTAALATNGGSFNAADGLTNAEKYGAVLAALSGVDQAKGGDTQAAINAIAAGFTVSGSTGTLSLVAMETLMLGAAGAASSVGGTGGNSLTSIVSSLTAQVSAFVNIDTIATDGVINAVERAVAITGTTVAGAAVALNIAGNTRTATVTGTNWRYDLQASDITTMGEGGEAISATATLPGGSTATATRSMVLDTVVPTITSVAITSATGAQSNTLNAGDMVYVTVTMSEATTVSTAGGTPQLALDIGGSTVQASYASGSGTTALVFSYTVQAGQTDADGISINADSLNLNGGSLLDVAGNAATLTHTALSDNTNYKVDTLAPTLTLGALSFSDDTGTSASDFLTKVALQTLSGTLSGVTDAGDVVEVSLDNGATWTAATNTTGQAGWSLDGQVLTGSNSLKVRVTDAAGNSGTAATQAYVLDTTAPATPTASDLDAGSDSGINSDNTTSDNTTSDNTPSFKVSAVPADATRIELLVDGNVMDASYDATSQMLTANASIADGSRDIRYRYIDAAGNVGEGSPALTVVIDTQSPANTAITGVNSTALTGTCEAGSRVMIQIGSAAPLAATVTDGTWRYVLSAPELTLLEATASTVITAVASDLAGNEARVSKGVASADFSAPTIVEFIPGDAGMLANNSSGSSELNMVFSEAVQKGTGNIKVFDLATNALIETIDVASAQVTITGVRGNDVFIRPSTPVAVGTQYYVTMDAGTFRDLDNVDFAGLSGTGAAGWDFTGAVATIKPEFVAQDDLINITEGASSVVIHATLIASSAIMAAVTAGDFSVTVTRNNGAHTPVTATINSYDATTGAVSFSVASNAWATDAYSYTISLTGTSGAAAGITANYSFANLVADLVAPADMSIAVTRVGDDTGAITGNVLASGGTSVTSDDATPNLSGTLSRVLTGDERLVIYRQDGAGAATRLTNDNGLVPTTKAWSFSDSGLQNGHRYTYTLYVEDAAGNRQANVNPSLVINTDTVAPTVVVSGIGLSADTGTSPSDFITKTAAQTITATLNTTLGAGELLYGSVDGGTTWRDISNKVSGTTLSWNGVTLSRSSSSIQLQARDLAGNVGATATQAYVLDTTAPTVSVSAVSLSDTGEPTPFFYSDKPYANITGTLSTALAAGERLFGSVDSGVSFYTLLYGIKWTDITDKVTGTTIAWTGAALSFYGPGLTAFKVTDRAGNDSANSGRVTYVVDLSDPRVSNIAITSASGAQNSTLNTGDTASVTVTMSKATTVSTSGGTPQLALNIGGTTVQANYASGSGSAALVFSYTIQAGDNDANGIFIAPNSLTLNGGTLKDAAGRAATLSHAYGFDNASYKVDTTAPTVTNISGAYKAAINTLVLTGTKYSTLLESGEDASTDIKARLDWSKLSWDINGDKTTTADVAFTLADINSAKVTDDTHLSIVLTSAKGTALMATTGFGGATADTLDIAAGFARDLAGNVATTDAVAAAALSMPPGAAGDPVIDLGSYGKLIAPVQVDGGKWYYYWDRSGNGTSADTGSLNGGADYTNHDVLDGIFKYDVNGVLNTATGTDTTDTYRYATINGVRLALPTVGGVTSAPYGSGRINNLQPGTAVGSATAADGSNALNATYNDLLAVWDAYNGTGTGSNIIGKPSGWEVKRSWWSATPSASGHALVNLGGGGVYSTVDTNDLYVALQVLETTAPTVTNTSSAYTAATNKTLVLTGTNYSTLLESGEDATTDIKARLDWSKLVWDINGDNATTANVGFTLADISSAKVTDGTHLSIVLTSAKGTALEATTGFGGATADTVDIAAGFARDVSGNAATTDAVANAALSITLPPKAGEPVIDLGSYGKLIAPVQVDGGKWYYYWDRSGDGTNKGEDYTTHDVLDGIFNQDINGVVGGGGNTTDTYRYATINGVQLALPTAGGETSPPYGSGGINKYQPGTTLGSATAANGSDAVNGTYNDLLAIWDAYNGTGTGTGTGGTPSGWRDYIYWSATSSASGHARVELSDGYVYDFSDSSGNFVALQVL